MYISEQGTCVGLWRGFAFIPPSGSSSFSAVVACWWYRRYPLLLFCLPAPKPGPEQWMFLFFLHQRCSGSGWAHYQGTTRSSLACGGSWGVWHILECRDQATTQIGIGWRVRSYWHLLQTKTDTTSDHIISHILRTYVLMGVLAVYLYVWTIYVCRYVCIFMCIYTYVCTYVCICVHVSTYVCMCALTQTLKFLMTISGSTCSSMRLTVKGP